MLHYGDTILTVLRFLHVFSEIFLDNVFNQLEEDGPKVCRLASTSRVLERLVIDAREKNILHVKNESARKS